MASTAIQKRQLGKSGLFVSQLGLGCMGLSFGIGDWKNLDRNDSIALIREAFKLGINFFDTAEVYGPHANEELVGEAISVLPREELVIATKCGIYNLPDGTTIVDSKPERIRAALEGSLSRLRTSYVDLYYIHRIDPSVPIEDVAKTMLALKEEGKIRHWGVSEAAVSTIRRAHAVFPLTAVQSEYSLLYREPEAELIPALEELGIGFVPFSPLGHAFLTATVTPDTKIPEGDSRITMPRFTQENREKNQALLDIVQEYAAKKNATPAQIALAWVMAQKPFIAPIPGTTKITRLQENIGSVNVSFTPEELSEFNTRASSIQISGERFNEFQTSFVNK